jgi:hypothetical protein
VLLLLLVLGLILLGLVLLHLLYAAQRLQGRVVAEEGMAAGGGHSGATSQDQASMFSLDKKVCGLLA